MITIGVYVSHKVWRNTMRLSDAFIFKEVDMRQAGLAAADAVSVSCAFHKDQIGLDTDAAVKLNCDEAKGEGTRGHTEEGERGP